MKILSLFDGLSCGRIALERNGVNVEKYYAAEIDKFATKVSEHNYPDIVRLGDVTKWQDWDIDWSEIDLVLGGFPCQAWSMAGKQLGDKDERGMLFWTMLDIIKHVRVNNPNADFLIENVKMKKEFEEYITHHTEQALGTVHKILINSALVSAQNRNRYYWTSWECSQPEDKGIMLADVLEGGSVDRDKSHCIDANYFKGGNLKSYFEKHRRQVVFGNDGEIIKLRQKSKCVRSSGRGIYDRHEWDSISDCHYRKLTPIECERLQTVPDNYTAALDISRYYLYSYGEANLKMEPQLCNVKSAGVKERREQKSTVTYALCTTRDLLGLELLSCQNLRAIKTQNVSIAIERLEKKEEALEECVIDITRTGSDMTTLYTQIKSKQNLDQEGIKSEMVVRTSTGKLLRIASEGICQEMKLFITLIAIKLITQLRICTYVTDRASIQFCIDSLKESQENLLSVALSSLRMETTKQTVSNTQRYKMLGNGWTVDVICHLLKGLD